jgi:hypothetical protein
MEFIAQSSGGTGYSGIEGSDLAIVLILLVILGVIVGTIGQRKGYNFFGWFLFGAFFFIIALIVVLVVPSKTAQGAPRAAASGSNAVVTHSGSRYLFGYTLMNPTGYAIWDREKLGLAILRFPYNEHGQQEGLSQFRRMEASAVELIPPWAGTEIPPPPGEPQSQTNLATDKDYVLPPAPPITTPTPENVDGRTL